MIDLARVADVIQEAEAAEIAPRSQRLTRGEIEEKSAGEVVTIADRACEVVLTKRLTEVADIPVVGEEAASADPRVLDVMASNATYWLVDPLDGTSNFAAGSPDYAVMVAFVANGVTQASWIWVPATQTMFVAERGSGATQNGTLLVRPSKPKQDFVGVIMDRFLPDDLKAQVAQRAPTLGTVKPGSFCAGIDYPNLARGEIDYLIYWRTLPWDHAPGALLANEAGCSALRPDGTLYQPHSPASGLLVAPSDLAPSLLTQLFTP